MLKMILANRTFVGAQAYEKVAKKTGKLPTIAWMSLGKLR
jgi:hypothetical protein